MLRHLGNTGTPLMHIENASASGSAAFRQACIEVASGISEVALAVGVDKRNAVRRSETGIGNLADDAIAPFTHFALLTNDYASRNSVAVEDIAHVAVKNHKNGSKNPNAQRQQARSLEGNSEREEDIGFTDNAPVYADRGMRCSRHCCV